MKIFDFDIKKGIYHFEFDELDTEIHAHPVVEIISASSGSFSLEVNGKSRENLVFAIIDSNVKHKVVAQHSTVHMLMIESHNLLLFHLLKDKNLFLENGAFLRTKFSEKDRLIAEIKTLANANDIKTPTDKRIADSIKFIEQNELEYKNLISELISNVFLSESRLSHLFKVHIGVSIKKYLVWNKLKQAINTYLSGASNLTDVSFQSGFFDQAHLSNSFKSTLGVSPSKAYNSRILQS